MSYYYILPSTRSSSCRGWRSRNRYSRNLTSALMTGNACNIKEDDDKYEVRIDVPGVKAKDIKVQLEDNGEVISIKTERKSRDAEHVTEHAIEKRLSLASNVDRENIRANVEDGFLLVTVQKMDRVDTIIDIPVTNIVGTDQGGETNFAVGDAFEKDSDCVGVMDTTASE